MLINRKTPIVSEAVTRRVFRPSKPHIMGFQETIPQPLPFWFRLRVLDDILLLGVFFIGMPLLCFMVTGEGFFLVLLLILMVVCVWLGYSAYMERIKYNTGGVV